MEIKAKQTEKDARHRTLSKLSKRHNIHLRRTEREREREKTNLCKRERNRFVARPENKNKLQGN